MSIDSSTSATLPAVNSWAVARTKSRCEKVFADYLLSVNVPCYLPLLSKRRVYGSAVRFSHLPLFSGYVFFDSSAADTSTIFDSRKIAQILTPPDARQLAHELQQIALALQNDQGLRESRFGEPGRPVVVARGPLKGLEGELVRIGGISRLVIRVSFLGKAAELEIDDAFIEPVN